MTMIWTWHIRRSWWLSIVWALALLLTVVAFCIVWVNWQGAHDWAQARARLVAEGEANTFDQLVPPLPPDELNFCAIPALRELCVILDHDPNKGSPAMTRKQFSELSPAFHASNVAVEPDVIGNFSTAPLPLIRQYLYEARGLPVPRASGNDARDLLAAMDVTRPLMKEMLAGVNRPQAHLLSQWRGARLSLQGDYGVTTRGVMGSGEAFALRARAALVAGDVAEAVGCVRVVLRLEQAFSNEPGLMGSLLAIVLASYSNQEIHRLVAAHALTDAQLVLLQKEAGERDLGTVTLRASRQELAMRLEMMELFEALPFWRRGIEWRSAHLMGRRHPRVMPLSWKEGLQQRAWDAVLSVPGVWSGSKASLANELLERTVMPLRSNGVESLGSIEDGLHRAARELPVYDGRRHMVEGSLSVTEHLLGDFALSEIILRQTLLALALERYRLAHQDYPITLGDLVPSFTTAVPSDFHSGRQMHYERRDANGYELRGLGPDGKLRSDDDEVFSMPPKDSE
ncbi:MAG: hypothetical protein JWO89_1468 [Verrucomicrobiaceae bacterium]|nr:hypothetical protein [Verrucomicrobiaceae bacterium]